MEGLGSRFERVGGRGEGDGWKSEECEEGDECEELRGGYGCGW